MPPNSISICWVRVVKVFRVKRKFATKQFRRKPDGKRISRHAIASGSTRLKPDAIAWRLIKLSARVKQKQCTLATHHLATMVERSEFNDTPAGARGPWPARDAVPTSACRFVVKLTLPMSALTAYEAMLLTN